MLCAIIESPYAGEVDRNLRYLRQCIRHAIFSGYSPYASHRMLTEALHDEIPTEREIGISAGYAWWDKADVILFYTDFGWSNGMVEAWNRVQTFDKPHRVIRLDEDL